MPSKNHHRQLPATFHPEHRFLSTQPVFSPPPETPQPMVKPTQHASPQKPFPGKAMVVIGLLVVAGIISWTQQDNLINPSPTVTTAGTPTAKAIIGDFQRVLRASGTVAAQDFAAIRTPRMQAGRDTGRQSSAMTLTSLATPGEVVRALHIAASVRGLRCRVAGTGAEQRARGHRGVAFARRALATRPTGPGLPGAALPPAPRN